MTKESELLQSPAVETLPTAREAALVAYKYAFKRNPELAAEFFLSFEPVAVRLLERYKPMPGKSFSNYLMSAIGFRWKSFVVKQTSENAKQNIVAFAVYRERGGVSQPEAQEIQSIPGAGDGRIEGRKSGTALRGLAYAALRHAGQLSDEQLRQIEQISSTHIMRHLSAIAVAADSSFERARRFRQTRDGAFASMLYYRALAARETDPERKASLACKAERCFRRMIRARRKLAQVRVVPTHAEISKELGIPKGTIDSAIHAALHNARLRELAGD